MKPKAPKSKPSARDFYARRSAVETEADTSFYVLPDDDARDIDGYRVQHDLGAHNLTHDYEGFDDEI